MRVYSKKVLSAIVFLVATCLAPVVLIAESAESPGDQIFGSWQIVCDPSDQCRMVQTIIEASTRRSIVEAKLFKGEDPTLLLTFPLGILLKTGWQYQIDDGPKQLLPFEICNIDGCHVAIKLNDRLVTQLKFGTQFKIQFMDAAQTIISPALSLTGFTKAYEAFE